MTDKGGDQWPMQYHLRYTPLGLVEKRNLGVILCPGHDHLENAVVQTRREDGVEIAEIGTTELRIFGAGGSDSVAELGVAGTRYLIGDQGLINL